MDPSSDHTLNWLSLPLRSHMSNTFNSYEIKSFILLIVAWDLISVNWISSFPLTPFLGDGPIQTSDPSFGSESRNGSISISWVVHHSVLILQDGINPLGSFGLNDVLPLGVAGAFTEVLYVVRNVQSSSDICFMQKAVHSYLTIFISPISWGYFEGVSWDSSVIILESGVDSTELLCHRVGLIGIVS